MYLASCGLLRRSFNLSFRTLKAFETAGGCSSGASTPVSYQSFQGPGLRFQPPPPFASVKRCLNLPVGHHGGQPPHRVGLSRWCGAAAELFEGRQALHGAEEGAREPIVGRRRGPPRACGARHRGPRRTGGDRRRGLRGQAHTAIVQLSRHGCQLRPCQPRGWRCNLLPRLGPSFEPFRP